MGITRKERQKPSMLPVLEDNTSKVRNANQDKTSATMVSATTEDSTTTAVVTTTAETPEDTTVATKATTKASKVATLVKDGTTKETKGTVNNHSTANKDKVTTTDIRYALAFSGIFFRHTSLDVTQNFFYSSKFEENYKKYKIGASPPHHPF